jgi:type II secretory pathway pseudopilin PulG
MLGCAKNSQGGFTLIEAMMAAALSALFLGSLFAMNTSSMQTIKMAREAAAASQVLQQRIESMRIANWHQVTDADWIAANLLNADASGSVNLKAISEVLTLSPYGSGTVGNTQLTRSHGSVAVNLRNTALLNENAVKVVWTVNYTGAPNDRAATRQTVAILAKGGVAK